MPKDYEVGYGKPPKHTRFRKGRSGNPKGHPGGHKNFSTDLKETLHSPVQLRERGQAKTVTTQRAALLRLREKALSGDARALDLLIALARLHNDEDLAAAAGAALAPSDEAILEAFVQRRGRNIRNPSSNGRPSAGDKKADSSDDEP